MIGFKLAIDLVTATTRDPVAKELAEDNCCALIPLVKRSAGLSADGQYCQQEDTERISHTLWLTNSFSFFWLAIQYSTIWLSDHRYSVQLMFREVVMKALSLTASTAAINSSFGNVTCLSGTALGLDITSVAGC